MTPEEQLASYDDYMSKLAYTSYFILVARLVRDFIVDKKKREIGRYVHKQTLEKVLLAPVNLFFDVTPIGKILSIFNGDLSAFYGRILDPFWHMCEMGSHIVVVISMYLPLARLDSSCVEVPLLEVGKPELGGGSRITVWGTDHHFDLQVSDARPGLSTAVVRGTIHEEHDVLTPGVSKLLADG